MRIVKHVMYDVQHYANCLTYKILSGSTEVQYLIDLLFTYTFSLNFTSFLNQCIFLSVVQFFYFIDYIILLTFFPLFMYMFKHYFWVYQFILIILLDFTDWKECSLELLWSSHLIQLKTSCRSTDIGLS